MKNASNEKMNNIEVMDTLMGVMSDADKKVLRDTIKAQGFIENPNKNHRRTIVHGILDAYSRTGDEMTKSGLKQLQKKYMNGARPIPGEDAMYSKFLEFIMTE